MFELSNYKDVDDTIGALVNQYYQLRDAGKYTEANALIQSNKETLKPYYINAESFNKIEEGIQQLTQDLNSKQCIIFSSSEPLNNLLSEGSEWIQEY